MIRKIGFHTLLVNDWRKEWQEEQRHKRKVALAAGIDPEVINKRTRFMLRNASLFFEDTSNDKFSRLTVLVDSTRKNYMPRKILFSLGYTQLRKCDGKRPILVGRDENLIPVMVLVDVQKNLDERGYARVISFLSSFVAAGRTVVVSTHDRRLVDDLGARELALG